MQCRLKANDSMHFDTLAKQSSVNREKYAAVLSVLIKEFEKGLPKKKSFFFFFVCFAVLLQTSGTAAVKHLISGLQSVTRGISRFLSAH